MSEAFGAFGVLFAFVLYGMAWKYNELILALPATFLFFSSGLLLGLSLHFHGYLP